MSYKEVNSSRVLFYLGKKFWEGHTTDIGSQGFHAPLNFLELKIQESKMCRDLADQRNVFSFISLLFLTLTQRARWRRAKTRYVDDSCPKNFFHRVSYGGSVIKTFAMSVY